MKRGLALVLIIVLLLLSGCSRTEDGIARGMALREKLLTGNGCAFDAEITADFGDKTYTFVLECSASREAALTFTVKQPESISGISGTVSAAGGRLTFDDKALAFPLLADGEVSPVSSPWLFVKTLMSGYLSRSSVDGDLLRLCIDDSYEADALRVDVWLNSDDLPQKAEIIWKDRLVVTIGIANFRFL